MRNEITMTDPGTARLPTGLPETITSSLVSLWTRYAGAAPTIARTEIRGNIVTCTLIDAVADFDTSMIASEASDTIADERRLTPQGYKHEAVAAIVRITRQRVASFISSHDRDTDVATEVFTLEPSLSRGAPALADRRRRRGRAPTTAPAGSWR
jgi:hypothetical protein